MINHFKELLQTDENKITQNQESNRTELGNLDFPITQTELSVASKILKAGKGTGIDTIRNEMISPLIEAYPSLIIRAFDDIIVNNISNIRPIMQLGTLIEDQRQQNGNNMQMGFQDGVIRDLRQDRCT